MFWLSVRVDDIEIGMSSLELTKLQVHTLVSSRPQPRVNHMKGSVLLDSDFFKSWVSRDIASLPHLLRMHHVGRRNGATASSLPCNGNVKVHYSQGTRAKPHAKTT